MGGIIRTLIAVVITLVPTILHAETVVTVVSSSVRDGGFEGWTANGGNDPFTLEDPAGDQFWRLNENAATSPDVTFTPQKPGPSSATEGGFFAYLQSSNGGGGYNEANATALIRATDFTPDGPRPTFSNVSSVRFQFDWTATYGDFNPGQTYAELLLDNNDPISNTRVDLKTFLAPSVDDWVPSVWKSVDVTYTSPFDGFDANDFFDDISLIRIKFNARGTGDGSLGDQVLYIDNVNLTITMVPEPSSLGLLSFGFVALAWGRRCTRRSS